MDVDDAICCQWRQTLFARHHESRTDFLGTPADAIKIQRYFSQLADSQSECVAPLRVPRVSPRR